MCNFALLECGNFFISSRVFVVILVFSSPTLAKRSTSSVGLCSPDQSSNSSYSPRSSSSRSSKNSHAFKTEFQDITFPLQFEHLRYVHKSTLRHFNHLITRSRLPALTQPILILVPPIRAEIARTALKNLVTATRCHLRSFISSYTSPNRLSSSFPFDPYHSRPSPSSSPRDSPFDRS